MFAVEVSAQPSAPNPVVPMVDGNAKCRRKPNTKTANRTELHEKPINHFVNSSLLRFCMQNRCMNAFSKSVGAT
jgi:hypothetical protein